jgi:hypothetical protein
VNHWSERWSWTQFTCAFLFAGFVAFLSISPPLDGFVIHLVKCLVVATVCGVLAGRFGDSAWRTIARWL